MEAKRKILVYSTLPLPYRTSIVNRLAERYDLDVFFENARGDDRNDRYFENGRFFYLDSPEGKATFSRRKRALKEYALVLIFELSTKTAVRLVARCRLKKVPYALNCDGVMLFRHGNFLKNLIKRYLMGKASAFLASGEHAKQYLLRYGADERKIRFHPFTSIYKADILPAPLSAEQKQIARQKLGLPQEGKLCVSVGRYIPLKRYDVLLRLWKKMPPDVYLLLIGGGPEKENYEAIIREQGLENVLLEDFHPFAELLEYYRAADLFLHPTSYDVWGLVINEAMASGLPVVVSDTCVAGLELVKNGENGYVVPLGEDDAFLKRTTEILESDDLRASMSAAALRTISDYTVEKMVASQMKTIGEVLSGE